MRLDVTSVADILGKVRQNPAPSLFLPSLPSRYYPWQGLSMDGKPHPLGSVTAELWCDPMTNEWVATLAGVLRYFGNSGNVAILYDMEGLPALRAKVESKFGVVLKRGTALRGAFYTDAGSRVAVSTLRGTWVLFSDPVTGVEHAVSTQKAVFNAGTGALVSRQLSRVQIIAPRKALAAMRLHLGKLLSGKRMEARLLGDRTAVMKEAIADIKSYAAEAGFDGVEMNKNFDTHIQGIVRRMMDIDTNHPLDVATATDRIVKSFGKFELTSTLRRV